ncbi:YcfL family protein [Shewanella maritima]|uniref:YcfL family protein n=1 Tax=Shewanella maritima TaxID=2520507 RepID=UPI003737048B
MKITQWLMIALALVVTGCANHTAGISASSTGDIRVDNRKFESEVSVSDVRQRMSGDLLQGSAVIASRVATDLRLQYKFTWYDAEGFTLEDEASSWKSLKLHGMQQMQVAAVAPNPQASRFEVYVRKAFSH